MYQRLITSNLLSALDDTPVILVNGARQTGKTTLVQSVGDGRSARYISLDDTGFLAAVKADPSGFIAGLSGPTIIDEVQRAPELFPAIKMSVDRDRTPGRFLLTGSANVMLVPRLSESLAGRMEILTLWPLAQAEVEGLGPGIVDTLYGNVIPSISGAIPRTELLSRVIAGGYPEPLARTTEARRRAWFNSYITTILQRDVRDIANIEGLTEMPRLLSLLATRSANLLNTSEISRAIGIPNTTLSRYMSLLQATFLVSLLPAWSANLGKRLVRSPKLLVNDTGLIASLLGLNAIRLEEVGPLFGQLLETFVVMEVIKDAGASQTQPGLFHFRTQAGVEVDLLLEDAAGRIVGIEVKSSSTVASSDFRGLRELAEVTGDRFHRGIVIYTGESVIPFGERLHAVPVQALWNG